MKKALNVMFVIMGGLFLLQLVVLAYLVIADPLNLKPLFSSTNSEITETSEVSEEARTPNGLPTATQAEEIDSNPVLNESQETALESVGINPTNIPTQISPEQEACFEQVIGVERVEEIKAGATPTALEIFRGRNCL